MKAVLVTGASRGLGKAIVDLLLERNCQVLASSRQQHSPWPGDCRVRWFPSDLADPISSKELVQEALHHFKKLDAVINNAGTIGPIEVLADTESSAWSRNLQINLLSAAEIMNRAIPALKASGGTIVNISSGAALNPVHGWSAYCTAKAGLLHLTRVVALENPEIACFSLRPGVIDTQMQDEIRNAKGMTETELAKFRSLKQNEQLKKPEVPARAAVSLALNPPRHRSGEFIQYTDPELEGDF